MCLRGIALVLVLFVIGCAANKSNLVTRSSYDLNCPVEQLKVTVLEGSDTCLGGIDTCGKVAGVQGCERKATYVNARGTWVQNTDSQPAK